MPQVMKSPDAFRTISEVSQVLELEPHVLRFWETKFAPVRPVKRSGGRRYYRAEDVALLGGIKFLLRVEGMTIKGVQRLLREKGVQHVAGLAPEGLTFRSGEEDEPEGADVVLLDGRRPRGTAEPERDAHEAVSSASGSERTGAGERDELATMVAQAVRAGQPAEAVPAPESETPADPGAPQPVAAPGRTDRAPIPLPAALLEDVPDDARLRVRPRLPRIDPERVREHRGTVRRHLAELRRIREQMERTDAGADA